MARLVTPPDAALPPGGREVRAAILASRGEVAGPFTVLLHSPALAGRVADVGAYVRFESELPADVRCLATLLVARAFDCAFAWAAWAPKARDAGLSQGVVDAIRDRRRPDGLTPEQATVHEFCRQALEDHRVEQPTYDAVCAAVGVQGAVDLAGTMGYFAMLSFVLNTFEVDPPQGAPRLP